MLQREQHSVEQWGPAFQMCHTWQQIAAKVELFNKGSCRVGEHVQQDGEQQDGRGMPSSSVGRKEREEPPGHPEEQRLYEVRFYRSRDEKGKYSPDKQRGNEQHVEFH